MFFFALNIYLLFVSNISSQNADKENPLSSVPSLEDSNYQGSQEAERLYRSLIKSSNARKDLLEERYKEGASSALSKNTKERLHQDTNLNTNLDVPKIKNSNKENLTKETLTKENLTIENSTKANNTKENLTNTSSHSLSKKLSQLAKEYEQYEAQQANQKAEEAIRKAQQEATIKAQEASIKEEKKEKKKKQKSNQKTALLKSSKSSSPEYKSSRMQSINLKSQIKQNNIEKVPFTPTTTPKLATPYFIHEAPSFYKGIYLSANVISNAQKYQKLLKQAKSSNLNVLVMDIQPKLPSLNAMKQAKALAFYIVGRIVVFEGGLKSFPASQEHIKKISSLIEQAIERGIMEIQLDYIRFSDSSSQALRNVSLKERYKYLADIIDHFRAITHNASIRIGADIFGRIPFNKNDRIGQNLELFANRLDVVYPMLYPSHFYGQKHFMQDPYRAVFEGITKSLERSDGSKIVAYIQAFQLNVSHSPFSYVGYIKEQIKASYAAKGNGFIAWNQRAKYDTFFEAYNSLRQ